MDFSKFIEFLRAKPQLVVTVGLIGLALFMAQSCRSSSTSAKGSGVLATYPTAITNVHLAIDRPVRTPIPTQLQSSRLQGPKPNVILSVHVGNAEEPRPAGPYAPYGRLLQCQLVNSVESGLADSPVIGLVVKDLWHDGDQVIPVGAELHGKAQLDGVRGRMLVKGPWVCVWQNGEELTFNGMALNREPAINGNGWSITDGSQGLEGDLIRSQSLNEIKLFLATAMAGVSTALQQQRVTTLGIGFVPATARNAAAAGSAQVMNTYAAEVLDKIKRDGVYIRVPAGKSFYVYVMETIDRNKAHIAGSRVMRANAPVDESRSPTLSPRPTPSTPSPQFDPSPFNGTPKR